MADEPPLDEGRLASQLWWEKGRASGLGRGGERAADIDEVVADDAESDPALHAGCPL